ncbi:Uncharacterised protein [Campylobacter jejuni subsp. doylei]|uniref:Uncharacterized protein n=1 Tax=Campylobacter jejuni subsp. doylei TaxID=32021 RepID=A0A3S5EKC8_CAMJU|nr:hypothetical protein [Campylobacter jejuni]VEG60710.1 Uncharacterised protein [Campylobacter jejuni subsp. doylei]
MPYYFIPNHANITNQELVFLYIGWSIRGYDPSDVQRNTIIKRMAENIYKDSLANLNNCLQNNVDYDLVMWFGLTYSLSTKTWLDQVYGVVSIVKELQKTFKKIKIYLDGMKICENNNSDHFHYMSENATQIIRKISSKLKDVEVVDLNGYTVKDAVVFVLKLILLLLIVVQVLFYQFYFVGNLLLCMVMVIIYWKLQVTINQMKKLDLLI